MKQQRDIYLLSPSSKKGTRSLPMISFSLATDSIDFSECDTLIFTSKQAVISAEKIDPAWKRFPTVAIGPATKKQIEALGGKVVYHPDSFYGETLSRDLSNYFRDKNLLYLRPKRVSFDMKEYLGKEGIFLHEQILYETSCIKYDKLDAPSNGAIIIFTSPSTISCFFQNFKWDESYTAVVIGEATVKHLRPEMEYVIADEPLIDACIKKAKSILS